MDTIFLLLMLIMERHFPCLQTTACFPQQFAGGQPTICHMRSTSSSTPLEDIFADPSPCPRADALLPQSSLFYPSNVYPGRWNPFQLPFI